MILSNILGYITAGALILLLIIILPCIVRILRQSIQRLATQLHLAVLRNIKGGDSGKDWRQEKKGMTEDKMVGWLSGAGERHSTRDKGHEEGGSAYAKAGSSLGSAPGYSRASTPKKTRVCLLYWFVLSPLTLLGAVPHHHLTLSVKELTYSSN